jgi:hypothetical protein
MEAQGTIYTQHEENKEWTSKLSFYKDEIKILTGRIEELASKNKFNEVLVGVEHFQNQLIIQRNNIDEILHFVKLNEKVLIAEIIANPVAVDHRKLEYHLKEKDMVESFEKNFNELRAEFKEFASKWM